MSFGRNNIKKISVSDIGLSKRDTPRQTKDVYPQNVYRGHTILNQRIVKRYRTDKENSIGGGKQGSVQSILFTDICWCWKAAESLSGDYWDVIKERINNIHNTLSNRHLYKEYIIKVNRAQNPYDSPVFSVFNGEKINHFEDVFGRGKEASRNVLSAIIPVGMHMKPDDSVLYTDAFFDRTISSEYNINRVLLCEKGEFHFKNEHPTQTLYKGDLVEVYLPEIETHQFGSTEWMDEYNETYVYKKYQKENRLKLLYRKHDPKKIWDEITERFTDTNNNNILSLMTEFSENITTGNQGAITSIDGQTFLADDTTIIDFKEPLNALCQNKLDKLRINNGSVFEEYVNRKRYIFGVMTETARKSGGTGIMIFNFHNLGLL